MQPINWRLVLARVSLGAVLLWNLSAAVPFVVRPEPYLASFQVSGVGGMALVQGLGVAFLMWQIPFVPAIWRPARNRICLWVVLVMQLVGLVGESWMMAGLPAGNAALRATGWRFILFDSAGLVLIVIALFLVRRHRRARTSSSGVE